MIDIPLMSKAHMNDSGRAGTSEGWCFLECITCVRGPSEENAKEREDKVERVTGFGKMFPDPVTHTIKPLEWEGTGHQLNVSHLTLWIL